MVEEKEKSTDPSQPQYDHLLIIAAFVYSILNGISLVAPSWPTLPPGSIWPVLAFWIFIAPAGAVFVICVSQLLCDKRPFTWTACAAFLAFLCTAVYFTFDIFARAAASV
jgi:hypothetical protein